MLWLIGLSLSANGAVSDFTRRVLIECYAPHLNGQYFITLVTQHRICHLGEIIIIDGRNTMKLSDWGNIVHVEWKRSFRIRNEIRMDEYIIMPTICMQLLGWKNGI